jgi:hypothetical protein
VAIRSTAMTPPGVVRRFQGAMNLWTVNLGFRCAAPQAIGCHAFGIGWNRMGKSVRFIFWIRQPSGDVQWPWWRCKYKQ